MKRTTKNNVNAVAYFTVGCTTGTVVGNAVYNTIGSKCTDYFCEKDLEGSKKVGLRYTLQIGAIGIASAALGVVSGIAAGFMAAVCTETMFKSDSSEETEE